MRGLKQRGAGFLGHIVRALDGVMSADGRGEVALSILATIDQRHDVVALPCFASVDFASASALATALERREYPQLDARRDRSVVRATDPFGKRARHGVTFQKSR